MLDRLVERLDTLGAVSAVVALVSEDRMALEPRWWVGYPDEIVDSWSPIALTRRTPLTDAFRGEPVIVTSPQDQAAMAAVALSGPSGPPLGVVAFSFPTPQRRTVAPGGLRAVAQELVAIMPDTGPGWATGPPPDGAAATAVHGPPPDLAVLDDPGRRAELARLGLGEGWGDVGDLVHRLTALATRLLGVDRAQVSLLGSEQWVASTSGFTLPDDARRSPLSESMCSVTVAGGAPLVIQDARNHPWVRDLPLVRDGGVRRYVGVPLVSAAGAIGALCGYDRRTRPLPPDAEATLADLAAAIMAALQVRTANQELAAAGDQLRRLQALTAQLSTAATQDAVADVVVHHGIELVARHGVVGVLSPDGSHLRTWTSRFPADLTHDFRVLPVDAATPMSLAVRTGRPVVLGSLDEIRAGFPDVVGTHTGTGTRSVVVLPARVGHKTLGAVAFGFEHEHVVDQDVLTYAHAVADLTGQALERARLYEHEHRAAHQLQRAMLPAAPRDLPGIRAAVSYRPADSGNDIGGDWYDVIALPDDRVGLVIGDVVGHDLHAAAVMGRLQAMLRGIAPHASGPAHTLDRLDAAIVDMPGAVMTTIGYGEYDPATGRLRYACAGHLPPLVVTDRDVTYLPDGRSIPLGVGTTPRDRPNGPRPEGDVLLAPGSLLLWCTDGLVERHDEDIDTGLQKLAALAGLLTGTDSQAHCDTIMAGMTDGDHVHDDIALLCVRLGRLDSL